ncbi:MAG: M20 family metallopeptidase [Sulfolobales archaeon]|nr:M20 family metallopeptidase [Sulfolobales archaeon]MCX8208797.1 M20 family metallopeptidase [Sulfolobales archaeon]MDW8010532.1 M20 family metallopeptidase [Sulfolobales archaeon]
MGTRIHLERNVEWGIKILKDMVSIPTVNPPGENYSEFTKLSREILEPLGFDVEVVEVPGEYVAKHYPDYAQYPRYVVLARYGSGRPVLHFNGHYDVVPAGSGWTRNPFEPAIEGGRLYGRGSSDMKGGIAAFIAAAKTLVESVGGVKGSLELALVPDEEIGGETGTGYLVRELGSRPDYVVIAEPSGSGTIWVGHKGALWVFVEVFGRQAHGSTPWLGVNAFEYMVEVANRFVREYVPQLELRKSSYEYDDPRGARPTAMVGGEVRGGAKVNVVPGHYSFSIDRRVVPEEKLEDVEKEVVEFVEKISKELKEVKISVRVVNRLPPALTNPDSELVRTVRGVAKEVLNHEPRTTVCLGGLDMRYYTQAGIQTVTYGPGLLGVAHIADEYLPLDEFEKMTKIYYLLMEKYLT